MPDAHTIAKDCATLTEARLAHEFNLGGQRMSWLVTSQAFLFAAWVQIARFNLPPEGSASDDLQHLSVLVPIVGLLVAGVGWFAVLAAQRVTDHLVAERVKYDATLNLLRMDIGREDPWTRFVGHLPGAVLPPVFVVAWGTVLARRMHYLSTYVWTGAFVALCLSLGVWLWRRQEVFRRIRRRLLPEALTEPVKTDTTSAVGADRAV